MAAMMLIAPPWWETATHILSLGAAYALALPVGWDRERMSERRHPYLSSRRHRQLRICAGRHRYPWSDVACAGPILEGLITGVGFIGGGAILKHRGIASGTATAASLWATGRAGPP
jgi:putative Mg2+ transporter-C (MgtC) family protein